MSVWLTIPSARPVSQAKPVIDLWRKQGYYVALWRECAEGDGFEVNAEITRVGPDKYPGYANAVNDLIQVVCLIDPAANWFVIGGDDTEPDAAHAAAEIERQCCNYFRTKQDSRGETYGVMQPTGDRWGDARGAYIDRICGSAWIGRQFATAVYDGKGPLWPEYRHMFVDEELQNVAQREGVLWHRRDLIQLHRHAMRNGRPAQLPVHLTEWYGAEHWADSKALFERRRNAGFPPYSVTSDGA